MRIRSLQIVTSAIAWLVLLATPASADCEPAGPLAEVLPTAEVAFVGETVEVAGGTATFAVSEIWAGEIGPQVDVHGIFGGGGGDEVPAIGEDDRSWQLGTTYLVLPFVDGGILRDHICTATTEWTDELEVLRPPDARAPNAGGQEEPAAPLPLVVIGLAVAAGVVVGVSWFAFRRRAA